MTAILRTVGQRPYRQTLHRQNPFRLEERRAEDQGGWRCHQARCLDQAIGFRGIKESRVRHQYDCCWAWLRHAACNDTTDVGIDTLTLFTPPACPSRRSC